MPQPLERRVTLRQLRILKTVIDLGSFTRAAEALSLSQPAVTHQMQALARALGHPLVQPGTRVPALTAVGEELYGRAGRILALVDEADEAVADIAGVRRGRVRVAGDTTVGTYVLPDAVAAFHREHPAVELSLAVVNRARVRQLLLRGETDIGVVGSLWEDDALQSEPFLENSLMCVSAPDHPLVAREPVAIAELIDGPLLLRETGSGTRASVERILGQAGVDVVASMELASNGALKRAVAGGLGVAVLSAYAVTLEVAVGLLRPLRVAGFPARRMWHIVWARDRLLSPAPLAFRAFLHEERWRHSLTVPLGTD